MGTRTPTYYTGTITGQNGTLITVLDAILVTGEGWTKTYSGTNKAVYTQASGNGFCLRVLDDGSGAGGAKEAEVRGAESASDVDTLVDPFPTVAQVSNANCTWRKSDSADSTTRPYWAVADGNCFHIVIAFGGSGSNTDMYSYGDTEPFYTGDGYNTFITTRGASNSSASANCTQYLYTTSLTATATNTHFCFARSGDGLIKADRGWWLGNNSIFGNTNLGSHPAYPNTVTNKLHCAFIGALSVYSDSTTAAQSGAMYRGCVPHIFEPLIGSNIGALANGDVFTDSAYDASSSFVFLQIQDGSIGTVRRVIMQTAGTWDPGY